jgi:hypothetical protein
MTGATGRLRAAIQRACPNHRDVDLAAMAMLYRDDKTRRVWVWQHIHLDAELTARINQLVSLKTALPFQPSD